MYRTTQTSLYYEISQTLDLDPLIGYININEARLIHLRNGLMKLILILGFWGCVLSGGALIVKSAQEQVNTINAIQAEKCAMINASLPGSCEMN